MLCVICKLKSRIVKKILFLTFWYPDEHNPIKGNFIVEHARALHNAGYNIRILAVRVLHSRELLSVGTEFFKDSAGLPTHLLSIRSVLHKWIYVAIPLLSIWVYRFYIRNISREFQPDIIHSNVLNPAAMVGHFIAKRLGKPHVITEHWSKVDKFFRRSVFAYLGAAAYREASAITVVSPFLQNSLQHRARSPEHISVVPNVVDPVYHYQEKPADDSLQFTVVAQWKPPKNIELIVGALQEIASESSRKVVLHIVGNGELLKPILENRDRFSFSIVHHGFLAKPQIAEILHRTDYFLHCSTIETFSLVVAEALSVGVPVVASNVGALPQLIDEQNGVLTNNTLAEWTVALRVALQRDFDRREIASNASQKYDSQAVAQAFGKVYDRLEGKVKLLP